MAERRMFAKSIVLSDSFLDMPMSARCLYFTLNMLADDDGFVNNPRSIMRQCGASIDDMNILIVKKYVISFDTGVIVIKDWKINNYLRSDRYTETKCLQEKSTLSLDAKGSWVKNGTPDGIPDGIPIGIPSGTPEVDQLSTSRETQVRLGKDRLGKDSIVKVKYADSVSLTEDEYKKLTEKFGEEKTKGCIEILNNYVCATGKKYKSHYHAILSWVAERYDKDHRFDRPSVTVEGEVLQW